MVIDITGVTRGVSGGYRVTGKHGLHEKTVFVEDAALATAIGNDPAHYALQDLVPSIVTLGFPALAEAFKS